MANPGVSVHTVTGVGDTRVKNTVDRPMPRIQLAIDRIDHNCLLHEIYDARGHYWDLVVWFLSWKSPGP